MDPSTGSASHPAWRAALLTQLALIVSRFTPHDGEHRVALPSLTLYRYSSPVTREADFSKISLVLAVQGAKTITVGDTAYDYDIEHFLLTSLEMPVSGAVLDASPALPYLSIILELDMQLVAELATLPGLPLADETPLQPAIARGRVSVDLLEAMYRLVRLLETPKHLALLAPLAEREVIYRLLMSNQGARLRHTVITDRHAFKVAKAVAWIKSHYAESFRVEELAQHVNMSLSSLHQRFKQATTLSPLQYQKHLRLLEARRLLVNRGSDVRIVASEVGYDNPSQFHREYKRLFGFPPVQDAQRLRAR